MHQFSVYTIMVVLCSLVVLSYVYLMVSKKTRIPTVLFLLATGMVLRQLLTAHGWYVPISHRGMEMIGAVGLTMLLLEAGLDLKFTKDKLPLIKDASGSAFIIFLLSMAGISAVIHHLLHQSWHVSLIYSVPMSIISSATVASSIYPLSEKKREFLTYESAFSDVFGILAFNYLVVANPLSAHFVAATILEAVIGVFLSAALAFLLLRVLVGSTYHVKFVLLFAALILLYSGGRLLKLPSLLVVLVFGVLINNWPSIQLSFGRLTSVEEVASVASSLQTIASLKVITAETAFLMRTIFFISFGYSMNSAAIFHPEVLVVGGAVLAAVYLVRLMYLRLFTKGHVLPELFYAPRGLMSVVLFYKIPHFLRTSAFSDGILFFVVIASMLILMAGSTLFATRKSPGKMVEAFA